MSAPSLAAGQLVIKLENKTSHSAPLPIIISVTMSNIGDGPLFLYRKETPFGTNDSHLASDQFRVRDSQGALAHFIGQRSYWGAPRFSHFMLLQPGQSVQKDIDLTSEYDFGNGGAFALKFVMNLGHEPSPEESTAEELAAFVASKQAEVESNEIVVIVDHPIADLGSRSNGAICTGPQNDAIESAKRLAHRRAFEAIQVLWKVYSRPLGEIAYSYHRKQRYVRWFGEVGPEEPVKGEAGWEGSLNHEAVGAVDAVYMRSADLPSNQLSPTCGCPGEPPETKAKVEDRNPYHAQFCDSYFALPEDGVWTTRTSVMAHELSHFYDRYQSGRSDYVYSKPLAEQLARDDRWKAVRNADNVEFFITDTTPYED